MVGGEEKKKIKRHLPVLLFPILEGLGVCEGKSQILPFVQLSKGDLISSAIILTNFFEKPVICSQQCSLFLWGIP